MKQKKDKLWFFPWQTAEGPHRSFLQMLCECAKFPNHVIEEPGDDTEHCVCGVLSLAQMPFSVLEHSLLQPLTSLGIRKFCLG